MLICLDVVRQQQCVTVDPASLLLTTFLLLAFCVYSTIEALLRPAMRLIDLSQSRSSAERWDPVVASGPLSLTGWSGLAGQF